MAILEGATWGFEYIVLNLAVLKTKHFLTPMGVTELKQGMYKKKEEL